MEEAPRSSRAARARRETPDDVIEHPAVDVGQQLIAVAAEKKDAGRDRIAELVDHAHEELEALHRLRADERHDRLRLDAKAPGVERIAQAPEDQDVVVRRTMLWSASW